MPTLPVAPWAPKSPEVGRWLYDESRAAKAAQFIEKCVVHTKGRAAGKPFVLTRWQREEIVKPIFGTVRFDEQYDELVRQYELAWIELARKNGKSELLSAFALFGLMADGEQSAEVYSVAFDRDQASLVYLVAKRMIELSPKLKKLLALGAIEIIDSRKRIVYKPTNSFYQVLPGDAGGALGTNPSMVLFDEVLTQRNRHLWDAMRQGFGTRTQSLMVAATTAAYTTAAFALEEHKWGEQVLKDPKLDPARFVFIRNVSKDWDWLDEGRPGSVDANGVVRPATGWYWSNPALGDFLSVEKLRSEAREARRKPSAQNAFRVFRLNQWTSQATRWLDMHIWDENGTPTFDREMLAGRTCFGGLDLASVSDITAWVLAFPGSPEDPDLHGFTIVPHFWMPRAAVDKRADMRESFEEWERQGFLTILPGDTMGDYADVIEHIASDAETYLICSVGYDPWNSSGVVTTLEDHGLQAVKIPQTAQRLNDPCKLLESLLADRRAFHAANPVLRWMADNVELDVVGDGLMKPSKRKSGEKIDGISATLNALYLAGVPSEEEPDVTFISFTDDDPSHEADESSSGWFIDDED